MASASGNFCRSIATLADWARRKASWPPAWNQRFQSESAAISRTDAKGDLSARSNWSCPPSHARSNAAEIFWRRSPDKSLWRSEERRVGKECRGRAAWGQAKEKWREET